LFDRLKPTAGCSADGRRRRSRRRRRRRRRRRKRRRRKRRRRRMRSRTRRRKKRRRRRRRRYNFRNLRLIYTVAMYLGCISSYSWQDRQKSIQFRI
jgi:hypothetical protein